MARRSFVAGNWKMNCTVAEGTALASALRAALSALGDRVQVAVAPPFTALAAVGRALEGSNVELAAQNCHASPSGAFTGEVSAPMLAEVGARWVILGHSERRQYFHETDGAINRKVAAALQAGLGAIVCVGETLEEREAGKTLALVESQLTGCLQGLAAAQAAKIVVAYEPVWAIGTGKTATAAQAQEVHAHLRGVLRGLWGAATAGGVRLQYGGSVKADNAAELLSQPDIDGALVGGASLKAADFSAVVRAASVL
jgi:triosephosphate isomerase (TIM)